MPRIIGCVLRNFAILLDFLFTEKYLLFLQKSCIFSNRQVHRRRYCFRGISMSFKEQKLP